jgi:hypothetical protein
MTAFKSSLLKDEEVAAVLTFVRNSWGNEASVIDPAMVAKVRSATADRNLFYQPSELTKMHPLEAALVQAGLEAGTETFSNEELEKELLAAAPADLAKIA